MIHRCVLAACISGMLLLPPLSAAFAAVTCNEPVNCDCSVFTNQEDCTDPDLNNNGNCGWVPNVPSGGSCVGSYPPPCQTTTPIARAYSGLGLSANADGSLAYIYFDPDNLATLSGSYSTEDYVVVFHQEAEHPIIKTRKASIQKMVLDTSSLYESKTPQLLTAKGASSIEFSLQIGDVSAGATGLVVGASAHDYITKNTVRSFEGLTGDVGLTNTSGNIIISKVGNDISISGKITVKGSTAGIIQFANSDIDDLEVNNALKFDTVLENLEIPNGIVLGTVGSGYIVFGDGTTQTTAVTDYVSSVNGQTGDVTITAGGEDPIPLVWMFGA